MDSIPPRDAIAFFGLGRVPPDQPVPDALMDQLEVLVLEHDLEVETDNRGDITGIITGTKVKEALFEEHRKKVGHRPDDPLAMHKARVQAEKQEEKEHQRHEQDKENLRQKRKDQGKD